MQIRQLTIHRYRGIETFTWQPSGGINCLVGPGDSFKSTVLAAISLLLAPYPLGPCSEFDYNRRRISDGFEIEAYIGNLDLQSLGTEQRLPHFYGWRNGAAVPLPEGDAETVLRCRVRGNEDLELIYELPIEGGGADQSAPFSSALRRKLTLARLAGEERASRDLRLGTGSLLDRHLKTTDMRASVHGTIADAAAAMEIPQAAQVALEAIRQTFQLGGLPSDLRLGLMPTQGNALVGMVTLMFGASVAEAIPIANSGSGTKQMALLSLSSALVGAAPVLVIDEPERGLEPHRQRSVVRKLSELAGREGQVFLTTHSGSILESLPPDSVWRMRRGMNPSRFEGGALNRVLKSDPEAFFAPTPILCEGATEMGLLDEFLPRMLGRELDACGVHLVDGSGQPNALDIADAFIAANIDCSAFFDNEASHAGRRDRIAAQRVVMIWQGAINIEDAVCKWLPIDGLFELIADASAATEIEPRYLEDQIYDKIPVDARIGSARDLRASNYSEQGLRAAFYAAMTRRTWFKRRAAGRILASALDRIGMPAEIRRQLDDFGNRLRPTIQ
jgi:putative ATP-dependent endonuclease of the OLD family